MAIQITFDDRELKAFERDLRIFAFKAYPHAVQRTLNAYAFGTRKIAQSLVQKTMVVKTRGKGSALGSILVNPSKTLKLTDQRSSVGSTQDFMAKAELGSTKRGTGRHGPPMATSFAARQAMRKNPRTKVPFNHARALDKIELRALPAKWRGRSRAALNAAKVRRAVGSSNKFVYLETANRKGIYEILGTKAKPLVRMVADMTRRSIVIPPHKWLEPATKLMRPQMAAIYKKQLRLQIHRQKIFVVR